MATDLKLRNTQLAKPNVDLGVIGTDDVYDMVAAFGASLDTAVTNTTASGTEIILTKTAGGSSICWISGRVPAGGFTLTSTFNSNWFRESNMSANAGMRFRVFKYTPGAPATLTELGGGPFNDGVEFGTTSTEMTFTGNVTDTAFAEDDRIVVKVYLTNVGTMGGGFTCTLDFNAASATTGDSLFQIAENITFKADPFTSAVGDTVSLTETAVKKVSKPLGELVGLTEFFSASKKFLKPVADTVVLTETFLKRMSKPIGETVGLTETFVKKVSRGLADTVSLTEARLLKVSKPIADTVALAEDIAFRYFKGLPETVVLSEEFTTQVTPGAGGGGPAGVGPWNSYQRCIVNGPIACVLPREY